MIKEENISMMTKEQVEDRIKKLEQDRDNLRATLVAYEGAIQESRFWLQSFDEKPEEVSEEK